VFPLVAGSAALIVAGPIYGFELVVLRFSDFAGTNLAVPIAGALFAVAMGHANPLAFRGRTPEGARRIPWTVPGGAYLVDEARPKYAQGLFLAASHGSPSLAILSEPESRAPDLSDVETVRLPPGPRAPAVLAATAAEFLHRHPTGAVLANDLSYAVANGGLAATVHAIRRTLAGRPTTGRLVLSLAGLTDAERDAFEAPGAVRVRAPNVEEEIGAILSKHLGASQDSLRRAALARGKRVEDLGLMDLPHVRDFVLAAVGDLRASSDEAAESGWGLVSHSIAAEFEDLWRAPPMERKPAAVGPEREDADGIPVIRAVDVVTERSEAAPPSPPRHLGVAVREAFLAILGPAGDPVYRRVMGSLRTDASRLRPEDLPKVAELAEEALVDLGGAIDVQAAQSDLIERARRLQAQLMGLARGER
ncbi:MAG TPA: hypothetical protein VGR51_05850, partial [Thermoplasmata archaeon]|nr:hypothetical protein [Thermoplasmata archaeon]